MATLIRCHCVYFWIEEIHLADVRFFQFTFDFYANTNLSMSGGVSADVLVTGENLLRGDDALRVDGRDGMKEWFSTQVRIDQGSYTADLT